MVWIHGGVKKEKRKNQEITVFCIGEWSAYTKESKRVMEFGDVIQLIEKPGSKALHMEVERIMGRL